MAVTAALYQDVRSAERHAVSLDGTVRDPDRTPHDVVIEDLSSTGFRIPAGAGLKFDDLISLGLPGAGRRAARVVWQAGERCGCTFLEPMTEDQLRAALAGPVLQPVSIGTPSPRPPATPEPDDPVEPKFSGSTRVMAVIGLVLASWAAAIGGAVAIAAG